jgi:hypothetical protein
VTTTLAVTANATSGTQTVYGVGQDGSLLQFDYSPRHNWTAWNISKQVGDSTAKAVLMAARSDASGAQAVYGIGQDGSLLQFVYSPRHNWTAWNISKQVTGNVQL